jgi:GTP-binding protein HflX
MEHALLAGIVVNGQSEADARRSLAELERLAETAGIHAAGTMVQRRSVPDPAFCIGRGKVSELRALACENHCSVVIFDTDLKPAQQKNLEDALEITVYDRTRLILDIFAQRARSREGILQVERARLAYVLPRLNQKGIALDSQAGGIGTRRGPGERKLELDQRRIRDRMVALDRELAQVRRVRQVQRQQRAESGLPAVAIAGYTNAGKSTLLNALSGSTPVYADNKLFATLDPTTRLVRLPAGRAMVVTDTVGFIDKLPHALVAAFRATLEEVATARCILHVVDRSHPDYERQMRTVYAVLKELGAEQIPVLEVFNKADQLSPAERRALAQAGQIVISAKTGAGVAALLRRLESVVTPRLVPHRLTLPYTRGGLLATFRRLAVIKKETYSATGTRVTLACTPEAWVHIRALLHESANH